MKEFVNEIKQIIEQALRSQFNWSQSRSLIQISDKDKREYYELEAANNNWTARFSPQNISFSYRRLMNFKAAQCSENGN